MNKEKQIKKLYKQRYLPREIAGIVKCSRQYVYQILRENGLNTRRIYPHPRALTHSKRRSNIITGL